MAFVRVKRRHDQDPFNSIVVSHKKLKMIGDSVFQFAATMKNENENLSQLLKEVREGKSVKSLTKTNKCKNVSNVIENSKEKRLKLVKNLRAVKQDTVPIEEIDGENLEIKVVDFVKQEEDNEKPLIDEGISIDYVYDLYYVSNNNDKSIDIQDIDSVHGLDIDKYFGEDFAVDLRDSSSCEDEDDSNDEGNWRNDYPDEYEGADSDDENFEDLLSQSERWNINSNTSSDSEERNSIEDYDYNYSRYKARVKAEESNYYNSVMDDSSSESSDLDD